MFAAISPIERSRFPRPVSSPVSRDTTSRAATRESGSMTSCTFEAEGDTSTTWPTSAPSATIGSFTLTPSLEPLSIVIDHSKFDTPLAIT